MIEVGIGLIVLIQLVIVWHLLKRGGDPKQAESSQMLKTDIDKLSASVTQLKDNLSDRLTDRLDKNQDRMLRSLHEQFQQSSKLITEVTASLTEIKQSNKQVVSIADELKTLQNILQNPKQRGVLGEYFLQSVLENVMPPNKFAMQYKFKNGEIVDAAIFLDKNKILPVDSKFSLENYNRLIEEKDKDKRDKYAQAFKKDLKLRIDETSKYIRPDEGTLDHAFMFIPSEAIYYDLLVNKVGSSEVSSRDLIEYAFREKHVIIVSPTTFMAYLQTVVQGMRSLQIEEKAKQIQKNVGLLGRHMSAYNDYMTRLGKSIGVTVNHYNNAHKELGKLDKDVMKIADTTSGVEPLSLDRPTDSD